MRRVLQSATIIMCKTIHFKVRQLILIQSAMVCYYKVRQLLLQSATGRSGKKWVEMEIPLFVKLALWISAQLINRNFAFFSFLGEH